MNPGISIRPSKELRNNYNRISALSRSNPVAITVNGKEDTVVLSHEDFVDQQQYIRVLEARLAVYEHLAQAVDDVKLGRTQVIDEAFDDILGELDEARP
ncbi:MAG: type II toxin-antitoxin system Phd/YefM family antitoxin [Clostridiales bacterium]|nr:type II toxin-antitoxin system Phd/YefM family antitoxin [Clostridiales bacterium]